MRIDKSADAFPGTCLTHSVGTSRRDGTVPCRMSRSVLRDRSARHASLVCAGSGAGFFGARIVPLATDSMVLATGSALATIALAVSAISLLALLARVGFLRRALVSGVPVEGIVSILHWEGRSGSVALDYRWEGCSCRTIQSLRAVDLSDWEEGRVVRLRILPDRPGNPVVEELHT